MLPKNVLLTNLSIILTYTFFFTIFQQFTENKFSVEHDPTTERVTYTPSVIINDRLYNLTVADLPPIRCKLILSIIHVLIIFFILEFVYIVRLFMNYNFALD